MSEATPTEGRERILEVKPSLKRLGLVAQYLWATRRSEVCGQYAFTGDRLELTEAEGRPVAVFWIVGAKLKAGAEEGLQVEPRPVALPLEEEYEPWTSELVSFIQKRGPGQVFRYSDTTLYRAARKAFQGLQYKIRIGRHFKMKPLATHGLRHIRSQELINTYNFDTFDLVAYAGWSPEAANIPSIMQRYTALEWRRYIGKLFRPATRR